MTVEASFPASGASRLTPFCHFEELGDEKSPTILGNPLCGVNQKPRGRFLAALEMTGSIVPVEASSLVGLRRSFASRLLKKAHLLCCARPARYDVRPCTPPLAGFRARRAPGPF